jgi:hypothetical protein
MELLKEYGYNPAKIDELERSVWRIKAILLVGAVVGLVIGVMIYLPA